MPVKNRHAIRTACEGNRTPAQKRYEGARSRGNVLVTVNGCELDPRLDLHNHSPNGFEWGYGGSGPAQLALALVTDHLADPGRALALYQDFKREVVVSLPHAGWTLTSADIERALRKIQSAQKGAQP